MTGGDRGGRDTNRCPSCGGLARPLVPHECPAAAAVPDRATPTEHDEATVEAVMVWLLDQGYTVTPRPHVERDAACPTCGQPPGEPCRSEAGRSQTYAHKARYALVKETT